MTNALFDFISSHIIKNTALFFIRTGRCKYEFYVTSIDDQCEKEYFKITFCVEILNALIYEYDIKRYRTLNKFALADIIGSDGVGMIHVEDTLTATKEPGKDDIISIESAKSFSCTLKSSNIEIASIRFDEFMRKYNKFFAQSYNGRPIL